MTGMCNAEFLPNTLLLRSARFIRPLSHRSAFNGIWLISLFVYKYIADTTANILKCVKVNGLAEHQKGVLVSMYEVTKLCACVVFICRV